MPLYIITRIKDSLGTVLTSLLLLECIGIQTVSLALPSETAESAENHWSSLSSAEETERDSSFSKQNVLQNKAENGYSEVANGSNMRNKSRGGHSPERDPNSQFLPDTSYFVLQAIRMRQKVSGNPSSIIPSDYCKQSFARAGPGENPML